MSITIDQLTMKFDDVTAVNNINFKIETGELVSLLGPSGCGKSTTLFMLAGIHTPHSGEIYFNDKKVTKITPEKRNIGMVFQNYALYPHMTVLQNVMFPLKMHGVKRRERHKQAMEALELVEIAHLSKRKPSQLSGGQQQRVAIARAIVRKPDVLLLDEPLSNLDAKLRVTMREEIRRIQQELGITTVFVTHDQEEAMSISDRIIVMETGNIVQHGVPTDLYDHPNSEFVADFIGAPQINTFNLKNSKLDDTPFAKYLNKEIESIKIRPEHLYVDDKGIPAVVTIIEQKGKDTLVVAEHNERKIRFYVEKDHSLEVEQNIYLNARDEHVLMFDARGKRVGEAYETEKSY